MVRCLFELPWSCPRPILSHSQILATIKGVHGSSPWRLWEFHVQDPGARIPWTHPLALPNSPLQPSIRLFNTSTIFLLNSKAVKRNIPHTVPFILLWNQKSREDLQGERVIFFAGLIEWIGGWGITSRIFIKLLEVDTCYWFLNKSCVPTKSRTYIKR